MVSITSNKRTGSFLCFFPGEEFPDMGMEFMPLLMLIMGSLLGECDEDCREEEEIGLRIRAIYEVIHELRVAGFRLRFKFDFLFCAFSVKFCFFSFQTRKQW
ncbi:hypothetical protein Ancab_039784 [Ancistrocladus abbreviatus]